MSRLMRLLTLGLLACALVCAPAGADDPPKKLTAEEREKLEAKWGELNKAGLKADGDDKPDEAEKLWAEALKVARQLYPKVDFPDGHARLATSMFNLGSLYLSEAKFKDAEPLLTDALAMRRKVFGGDHVEVATALNSLGMLNQVLNKPDAAEGQYKESIAMLKRVVKGDHYQLTLAVNSLGALYWHRGKYADAEPLFADALAMNKRLFGGDHQSVAACMGNLALVYLQQGKFTDAEPLLKGVVAMDKRLYPGGHPGGAAALNNLASLYEAQGRFESGEPLLRDALAARRKRHKGDHPDLATSLNNLATNLRSQGKHEEAEPLAREALEMRKRLFPGDHADVASSLDNLAQAYVARRKFADAEPLYKDALAMHKRLRRGAHPAVAQSLNNLAALYYQQGKYADVEPLLAEVTELHKALFVGDHPDAAAGLGNLGTLSMTLGKYADAERRLRASVEMKRRIYAGDQPSLAGGLSNLGHLYAAQGKTADAEAALAESLAVYRRLAVRYAKERSEGETLDLIAAQPVVGDLYLSNARAAGARPDAVYPQLWAHKGYVARVYERRHQQARAAATSPEAAKVLADLTDARRRRAELLLAPALADPGTQAKRKADIQTYEDRVAALTRRLNALVPAVERADRLAAATPADLQKVLPPDAAVVDYFWHMRHEQNPNKPGKAGETTTLVYVAFVVTRDAVARIDLAAAAATEPAIDAWRDAITSGKEIPPAMPAKVRELVWERVRKELPAGTKTVYVCPDVALCRLPFAALPGDKPNTVLLDDYAIATIPHAPFLLDKLWPQDPPTSKPAGALVVGGVKYDVAAAPVAKGVSAAEPLVKPDAKLVWKALPSTVGEAVGAAGAAERKKLTAVRLNGEQATPAAVLAALPKAKVAHFATHGFFADPSFRGVFNLDPKDFEIRGGERVGRAVNSPLVMTGLVFAGANDPKAPGRGIVTGEQLIDLDLSGLELAVLSACETGVGAVADGQGVFGLQRAFHYAGATNVVCSLWKVPDEPTAALMSAFYTNLWDKGLSPMESLRRAQLEIYRNPGKIPALAKGFRGVFEEVEGPKVEAKAGADGTAHPLLWAAFALSGPGR